MAKKKDEVVSRIGKSIVVFDASALAFIREQKEKSLAQKKKPKKKKHSK